MKFKKRLLGALVIFVLLILIGGFIYKNIEGWRYLDSVYFSAITITTIGYGDLYPKTDAGKIFTIFFALAGISMVLYLFSIIGRSVFNLEFRKPERKGVIKIRTR